MAEIKGPPFSIKNILGSEVPNIEVLDIGAMISGENCYARLLEEGLATVTGFEPNPTEYDRLCREGPDNCTWLPHFLGDGGEATFHRTRFPGCSSFYVPDSRMIDLFERISAKGPNSNFHVVETEKVQTKRLDDVDDCPPFDFLKIDVQGAELDVLQNSVETLKNVTVIQTEVEFVPMYKDQPLFGDIQVFLRECGFQLHKFIDVAGRCFRPFKVDQRPFAAMSQVLWADAIFVRDFSVIDGFTNKQLLKAAIILHELYLSYDLVLFFLMRLDDKQGSNLAPLYSKEFQAHSNIDSLYFNLREDKT